MSAIIEGLISSSPEIKIINNKEYMRFVLAIHHLKRFGEDARTSFCLAEMKDAKNAQGAELGDRVRLYGNYETYIQGEENKSKIVVSELKILNREITAPQIEHQGELFV